jgi:S-adenosylmethionine synthetase
MARHIALTTLHNNPEAKNIKVQLSYAIGEKYPISYRIFDSTNGKEYSLQDFNLEDLTPSSIIDYLELKSPIYLQTSRYGHFGNPHKKNGDVSFFKWESYQKNGSSEQSSDIYIPNSLEINEFRY